MATFRKYGGTNFSQNANIVSHNMLNSKSSSLNTSGSYNSKETYLSHVDLSGNSLLHVGNLYFQDGTSISSATTINPGLSQVLDYGSNAEGKIMTNVGSISFSNGTTQSSSYTGSNQQGKFNYATITIGPNGEITEIINNTSTAGGLGDVLGISQDGNGLDMYDINKITQPITTGDVSTKNNFKLSEFSYNSNAVNGTGTAFEFFDNVNGKGLFLLPNSDNGTLSQTNRRNDCCLTSRSSQNNNSIVVSNWNDNLRNGLRVATTDISNCELTLQCGQNSTSDYAEFKMAYNRNTSTTTTTFNNVINFNPTLPSVISGSRRRLEGLGTLSFTDISSNSVSGSTTSSIWTDSSLVSSLNGMYYDCGINGGFHQFIARDSGGTASTPIYYGANITSVSNTFIVRNASIPSNRFDVVTDTSQNTNIRARSTTASTDAHIHINCDSVNASSVTTNNAVLTITPTSVNYRRPIQFNYLTTPSASNQLGHITGPTSISGGSFSSSVSERNFSNFTIVNAGTYSIKVLITLAGNANHTLTECRWCLDGTSGNFPSTSTPTKYTPSITGIVGASLSSTYTSYMNINLDVLASANNIFYINFVLNYSGGSSTTLNAIYSYTRIG